jgi:hypothetical protein
MPRRWTDNYDLGYGGRKLYDFDRSGGGGWKELERRIISKESERLSSDTRKVRLVGLLFGQPASPVIQSEILPRIDYWHLRTGKNINIFCIGFGDESKDFNALSFYDCIYWLQARSKWKYSGETELVLLNARRAQEGNENPVWSEVELDLSSVVTLILESAMRDKAINSVASFMEQLIQFTENYSGNDPAWGFSDAQAGRLSVSALTNLLLAILPAAVRNDVKRALHFYVSGLFHAFNGMNFNSASGACRGRLPPPPMPSHGRGQGSTC